MYYLVGKFSVEKTLFQTQSKQNVIGYHNVDFLMEAQIYWCPTKDKIGQNYCIAAQNQLKNQFPRDSITLRVKKTIQYVIRNRICIL